MSFPSLKDQQPPLSSTTPFSFSIGLWNCQLAVNKADLIYAFSLQ